MPYGTGVFVVRPWNCGAVIHKLPESIRGLYEQYSPSSTEETPKRRKYLYDIVDIKENTGLAFDLDQKARGRHNAAMQSSASADSIRNSGENVNKNFSTQERGTAAGARWAMPLKS